MRLVMTNKVGIVRVIRLANSGYVLCAVGNNQRHHKPRYNIMRLILTDFYRKYSKQPVILHLVQF